MRWRGSDVGSIYVARFTLVIACVRAFRSLTLHTPYQHELHSQFLAELSIKLQTSKHQSTQSPYNHSTICAETLPNARFTSRAKARTLSSLPSLVKPLKTGRATSQFLLHRSLTAGRSLSPTGQQPTYITLIQQDTDRLSGTEHRVSLTQPPRPRLRANSEPTRRKM